MSLNSTHTQQYSSKLKQLPVVLPQCCLQPLPDLPLKVSLQGSQPLFYGTSLVLELQVTAAEVPSVQTLPPLQLPLCTALEGVIGGFYLLVEHLFDYFLSLAGALIDHLLGLHHVFGEEEVRESVGLLLETLQLSSLACLWQAYTWYCLLRSMRNSSSRCRRVSSVSERHFSQSRRREWSSILMMGRLWTSHRGSRDECIYKSNNSHPHHSISAVLCRFTFLCPDRTSKYCLSLLKCLSLNSTARNQSSSRFTFCPRYHPSQSSSLPHWEFYRCLTVPMRSMQLKAFLLASPAGLSAMGESTSEGRVLIRTRVGCWRIEGSELSVCSRWLRMLRLQLSRTVDSLVEAPLLVLAAVLSSSPSFPLMWRLITSYSTLRLSLTSCWACLLRCCWALTCSSSFSKCLAKNFWQSSHLWMSFLIGCWKLTSNKWSCLASLALSWSELILICPSRSLCSAVPLMISFFLTRKLRLICSSRRWANLLYWDLRWERGLFSEGWVTQWYLESLIDILQSGEWAGSIILLVMRRQQPPEPNDSYSTNQELEVSFARENHQMQEHDQRLNMQIYRMLVGDKQQAASTVWAMQQAALCDFFTQYEPFPDQEFNMAELLESNRLKLVKKDGKIYFGLAHQGKREGQGIQLDKDGKIYEGSWSGNEKNGRGVEVYPNGNLYIGEFGGGKKHGIGSFYWFNLSPKDREGSENVEYYEGSWWGGLPDGSGTHQKVNGDLYNGYFKNGLKHGQGIQAYGNGDTYKGEFINGLPQGFGQYDWEDGSSFRGDFKQGKRNGYGLWKGGEHSLESYKGHYAMDMKNGHGVYTWQNGWLYKGNFQNDYRHGYGELYDNSQVVQYRGFWQNGEKVEREVVTKPRLRDTTFKSLQITRQDPRILPPEESLNLEKKPARPATSTGKSQRSITSSQPKAFNLRRYSSSKKKEWLNRSGKFTTSASSGGKGKSVGRGSMVSVGSIKANLFVPMRVSRRSGL